MKTKGKIGQIIKWKDKESFFCNTDFGDEKVDLLHIAQLKNEKIKWYNDNMFYFLWSIFRDKFLKIAVKPIFKYSDFMFHSKMNMINDEVMLDGLPVLVSRPNDYKVGDIVEIEINIKKC